MKQLSSFFCLVFLAALSLSGCREKAAAPAAPAANVAASPAPGVNVPATVAASPLPPGTVNPGQAVVPGQMPKSLDAIPEQLRRPLTLDEIKKLPPESRDVILKAIGQPVPAATPKK